MAGESGWRLFARMGIVLVLGALIVGVATASASAATPPSYTVVVCAPHETCGPTAPPAVAGLGASNVQFSATVTDTGAITSTDSADDDPSGALNNLTLTAPASFTINSASCTSPCSASTSGGVVTLSGLGLGQGASTTVTISANTPGTGCTTASSCAWTATNAYNGDNDSDDTFNLDSANSALSTVLAQWAFSVQPNSAQVNTPITSTAYNTPPGNPVTVVAQDSSGGAVSYNGSDQVSLTSSPSAGLSGAGPLGLTGGSAVFSSLTASNPGYNYQLTASSPSGPNNDDIAPSAMSNKFDIHTAVSATQCSGTGCSGSTTNNNGTLGGSSSSTSGQLLLALDPTSAFWTSAPVLAACNNYKYLSSNADTVQLTGAAGSITFKDFVTLPEPNLVALAKTWLTQQICLAASAPFTAAGGLPASAVTLPDGSPGYAGLLTSLCSVYPNAPCVTKRTFKIVTLKPLVVTFEIDATIPASLAGDPQPHH